MSSSTRAPAKTGAKGARQADKSHKNDKCERGKGGGAGGGGGDKQHHKDASAKNDDPSIKDKVKTMIDMTQRSEEEVCLALYEADYDLQEAINVLFENIKSGEWETRVKKKKNRQASASGVKSKGGADKENEESAAGEEWSSSGQGGNVAAKGDEKEKGGNRGRGRDSLGGNRSGRNWRGRERHENERNQDDRERSDFRDRRGRQGGGGGGSSRGGRGRGGGRAGGRYPPRNGRGGGSYKPMETWDNSNQWDNSVANHAPTVDTWDEFPGADEWSTEEYQGSLADTKVFTPSVQPQIISEQMLTEPPGLQPTPVEQSPGQSDVVRLVGRSQSPLPTMVGALTAAQTQYFSQLQQNASAQGYEKGQQQQYVNQAGTFVNSSYQSQYVEQSAVVQGAVQQQPVRAKTQRARVPPPSKIPSSAVEMPGDLNSNIGYLDVQFGALDLIDSNTTTFDDTKFNASSQQQIQTNSTNLDSSSGTDQSQTLVDAYSTSKSATQGAINSGLSQSLSNADGLPSTSEQHLSNAYNSAAARAASATSVTQNATSSAAPSNLDSLNNKNDALNYQQSSSSYGPYQTKGNSYNVVSTYANTQTTNSYSSNQSNSYVNNQSASSYNPSASNYQNAYSTNAYQPTGGAGGASGGGSTGTTTFPSITQSNSYPSNSQSYQQQNSSQSVYGASTGLSSGSSYVGNTSSTSQYNSYGAGNKLVKDAGYETSTSSSNNNSSSNSQTTGSHAVTSSQGVGGAAAGTGGNKTSTTLAKSSNSVVSNIPTGMPVMSTPYIMGQMPYFQPPVYTYEEMQLLQQRLPHMTTPYYDMSYQTPTAPSAANVRDSALSNVGYSMSSDGRFTRADNNASPVPSTVAQSTSGGHQAAPILAAGAAPPYFFATAFNTIAPNYQFGTMYTQLPAATNAHGSSNSTQYPKPGTYGSGYGSYDALNQTQDAYSKGGYVSGASQGQKNAAGANANSTGSGGNDLSAMYAKTHTALGKVNTYEKQGFHSGTPPPFTGAIHGSQNAGLAPSGGGYTPPVYIPTMAAHQQHHLMQQPLHQMDVRHQGRRSDSGNSGTQRSQTSNQSKSGAKQPYQASYWNPA